MYVIYLHIIIYNKYTIVHTRKPTALQQRKNTLYVHVDVDVALTLVQHFVPLIVAPWFSRICGKWIPILKICFFWTGNRANFRVNHGAPIYWRKSTCSVDFSHTNSDKQSNNFISLFLVQVSYQSSRSTESGTGIDPAKYTLSNISIHVLYTHKH